MSYTPGTALGLLRELIGDTSPLKEVFDDAYLEALLDEYSDNVGRCAISALTRLRNDPDLIRQKYAGLGKFGINELMAIQRSIIEQIRDIKEGHLSTLATSSSDTRFPEADVDVFGQQTDEDGWYTGGDIEDHLTDLDSKIR